MERKTLNGANISNYSWSVTFIGKRSWAGGCSNLRMSHGGTDPRIKLHSESSIVGMGITDPFAGATINLLGQLDKMMLLEEKIWGII